MTTRACHLKSHRGMHLWHHELDACRRGVRLVNVARGGLIDRQAIANGLQEGRVAGVGLDVQWQEPVPPDDPLLSDPRVCVTPHIAGVTQLSYRAMADVVVRECIKVSRGEDPTVWVNNSEMLHRS